MLDAAIDERDQRRMTGKYFGKYPGLVLDNAPPEGAAHRGQLKVQIPGLLEETPAGSDAQPIETIAAPSFLPGFFFIPEVGDHVWVEFVAGDINCAIWTGVWYPTGATPKMANEQAPTEFQKVIRTASGHVVQLDDTQGEEKIDITHKAGAKLIMDKNGSVLLVAKNGTFVFLNAKDDEVALLDNKQNVITLTKDGITLSNKESTFIELNNNKKMKLASKQTIQVTAQEVIVDGGSINLGGNAAIPSSLLLASQFLALFDTHVHGHPMGPTTPPVVPMTPMAQTITSQVVKVA